MLVSTLKIKRAMVSGVISYKSLVSEAIHCVEISSVTNDRPIASKASFVVIKKTIGIGYLLCLKCLKKEKFDSWHSVSSQVSEEYDIHAVEASTIALSDLKLVNSTLTARKLIACS